MKFKEIPRREIVIEGYRLRFQSGREDIDELASSIERNGLLTPLTVRKSGDKYVLIDGFRRISALDKLNWDEIPCVILDVVKEREALVKGIVENVQRVNLSPLERAKGFLELIEHFNYSQQEIADLIVKSQGYVSQHVLLIQKVHPRVLEYLREGKIDFGHARILMRLKDQEKQLEIADRVIKKNLTINETALIVDQARPPEDMTERETELNAIERDLEKKLKKEWRGRINIRQGKKQECLMIDFSQRGELKELLLRIADAL